MPGGRSDRERNSEISLSNLGHGSPEKLGLKITQLKYLPSSGNKQQSAANRKYLPKLVTEQKHQASIVL